MKFEEKVNNVKRIAEQTHNDEVFDTIFNAQRYYNNGQQRKAHRMIERAL